MTVEDLVIRFKKLWWVFVLVMVVTIGIVFPQIRQETFIASTTVGLQLNNENLPQDGDELIGYTDSLEEFSLFLTNRYNAIEVQTIIASEADIETYFDDEEAFYTVINQGGGFVNVSYLAEDEEQAENFVNGVQSAYETIVNEWNSSRLTRFQITPQTEFTTTVQAQELSTQLKLLPIITGFLVGLLLIIIIPIKK